MKHKHSLKKTSRAVAGLLSISLASSFAAPALTEDGGQPVGDNQNSRTAGENGGVLLDNFHLIQKLARFDRERIPERVVHPRGVGAGGTFTSYGDFSELTKAGLFSKKGKETPVFLRFSTVIHPKGSPESLRDPRGFAVKFYTDEGNWDLVGNNLPVFFIRDAMKFPDMVHSLKPSPVTNQQDPNRFFDFFSHVPESINMWTYLFSDKGTPANLRQMDGFGVHAFKFVNKQGEVRYVKFTWHSQQGHKTMTVDEANAAAAKNHSFHTADLYEAIANKKFPSWELGVKILKPEQFDDFDFNPLDATKIWPNVPETILGKMTLTETPGNFFQATEQAAFSPGLVVPGIEPSEDRLLQGRLFSYADTQRYRIGANYMSLPVNAPRVPVSNINQDGALNAGATTSDINFQPSRTSGHFAETPSTEYSKAPLGKAVLQQRISKTDNFTQAGELYRSYSDVEKDGLIKNFSGDLSKVKDKNIQLRILSFAYQADVDYGTRLAKSVGQSIADVQAIIKANEGVDPIHWKPLAK